MLKFEMSQKRIRKLRVQEKVKVAQSGVEIMTEEKYSIIKILKDNWKFLTLLSIGTFLLYVNGLNGDFVSDDYATILNNPEVKILSGYFKNLTPVTLSNYLLAVVFGVMPAVYHTFSVLFYILVCWEALIFLNFIVGKWTARLTMVIFAVLPMHVEAVTWISGKPYLYIAFFVLLSLILCVKYLEENKFKYLLLALVSFVAIFTADTPRPFSLFPLIFLYLITVNKKSYWNKVGKMLPSIIGVSLITIVAAIPVIVSRVSVVNGGTNASDSIFYNPFFQYPTGIAKYLQLLLIPTDLTLYHTMFTFPAWLNWFIFLNLLGIIIYSFFKNKLIFFSLVFFLVTLLPSMAPVKVSWLVAERYAFLPSLGFCLFLAVILEAIWSRAKYLAVIPLALMLTFYTYRSFIRNIDWTTNHKLWVNTCQVSPNSHNAWNNIGDDYDKLNDPTNAVKSFSQSTIVKPNYADAYHNRANILFKTGRLDLARESYNVALNFSPSLYQTYLSLTQIDLMENRINMALEHSQKAVELQPENPQSLYVLGVVYAQSGNIDEAENVFTTILRTYPDYKLASDALASLKTINAGITK